MNYIGNDFYCDVDLKNKTHLQIEYEPGNILAYHHTKPAYPVHIIVVPKKHIASFTALTKKDRGIIWEIIEVLKDIAARVEKSRGAARIVTNLGKYQDSKHLHFHITSGAPVRQR